VPRPLGRAEAITFLRTTACVVHTAKLTGNDRDGSKPDPHFSVARQLPLAADMTLPLKRFERSDRSTR
jgi:hypothetical protein